MMTSFGVITVTVSRRRGGVTWMTTAGTTVMRRTAQSAVSRDRRK